MGIGLDQWLHPGVPLLKVWSLSWTSCIGISRMRLDRCLSSFPISDNVIDYLPKVAQLILGFRSKQPDYRVPALNHWTILPP